MLQLPTQRPAARSSRSNLIPRALLTQHCQHGRSSGSQRGKACAGGRELAQRSCQSKSQASLQIRVQCGRQEEEQAVTQLTCHYLLDSQELVSSETVCKMLPNIASTEKLSRNLSPGGFQTRSVGYAQRDFQNKAQPLLENSEPILILPFDLFPCLYHSDAT